MYPPGYRSEKHRKARVAAKEEEMRPLMELKKKMEEERAEKVRRREEEKVESKKKSEKERAHEVREAVEKAKMAWEAAAVARQPKAEKEAFRAAWYRGLETQRWRGNRRITGVAAELEMEAEWAKYEVGQ